MTREEAIEQLQDAKDGYKEYLSNDALDMAIKALEQEPTTKTCRTCGNFGSHHGICEICKDNKCWTGKEPTNKNDVPDINVGKIDCSNTDCNNCVNHKYCDYESITKNDLGGVQDLVSTITEKIYEQVTESHEEFIFETIRPYCENVVQMKISKRELEQALLKYYGKNDLAVEKIVDVLGSYTDLDIPYKHKIAEDILNNLPSVTPQEPFINKPCVSEKVCEHDKQMVLDKLRAEIKELPTYFHEMLILDEVMQIIDKYRAETEEENVSL